VNDFVVILSVRLELDGFIDLMDHAAFDRDGEVEYLLEYADFLEGAQPTLGESHVDRAAALAGLGPAICTPLIDVDTIATPSEIDAH
jgi:hypothetical protein